MPSLLERIKGELVTGANELRASQLGLSGGGLVTGQDAFGYPILIDKTSGQSFPIQGQGAGFLGNPPMMGGGQQPSGNAQTSGVKQLIDRMYQTPQNQQGAIREEITQINRQEDIARDRQKAEKEANVPGFTVNPDATPSSTSAQKVKDQVRANITIQRSLKKLHDLTSKYGTAYVDPNVRSDMKRSFQEVLINAKELENLGVLQPVDVTALGKMIVDPTDRLNITTQGNMVKGIEDYSDYVASRAEATAASSGYTPVKPLTRIGAPREKQAAQVAPDTAPANDSSGAAPGPSSGAPADQLYSEAADAIQKGAPAQAILDEIVKMGGNPDVAIQKLTELGVDFGGQQ